jgi:RNA polymerase sigma-70 factor (ECF subfamily)
LEEQDRSRWVQAQIAAGLALLERALAMQRAGPYQIQAAICALHAQAAQAEDTDWAQIVVLYDLLRRMMPSPVVDLNRAVAVAMAQDIESGLELLESLAVGGELKDYYLLYAARADLLRRLGRVASAADDYRRALDLCQNESERAFLNRRLSELDPYS